MAAGPLVGMVLATVVLLQVLPEDSGVGGDIIFGVAVFSFGVILSRARKRSLDPEWDQERTRG